MGGAKAASRAVPDLNIIAATQDFYRRFFNYPLTADQAQRILSALPPETPELAHRRAAAVNPVALFSAGLPAPVPGFIDESPLIIAWERHHKAEAAGVLAQPDKGRRIAKHAADLIAVGVLMSMARPV